MNGDHTACGPPEFEAIKYDAAPDVEPSPTSSDGISASSQATECDATDLLDDQPSTDAIPSRQTSFGIPDNVEHYKARRSRYPVWDVIHLLKSPIHGKTKALYMEHREIYRRKYAKKAQSDDTPRSASVSPNAEVVDASESEMNLLYGEEVSERAERALAESSLYKDDDLLMGKWFTLRIEWAEVAKHQYTNADERSAVLSKLSMSLPNGKQVWNVERLCQLIDVRRWLLETGEPSSQLFPR
ncbi:unnamed protein product [Phytophthora fragariaefolia]|uniref:Unnamed protein product n=1 Tax=Phytophthora fragariaefolia TaxID=1490495 RepID=A0A9W6YKV0_9STRA|nr:unnamed protein product [Phytophthora fragariaefolia]